MFAFFYCVPRFVQTIVAYYYSSDSEVSRDPELQEWANEIFYYGFLGNHKSGMALCHSFSGPYTFRDKMC